MKRLNALVPNIPGTAPGQQVRIETWAQHLGTDWQINFYPFEDNALHQIIYQPGKSITKALRLVQCYWRQLRNILQMPACDVLFIYREAALIGPAWLERIAARKGVQVVYDLDDPVFLSYRSPTNGWLSLFKFSGKTHSLFRLANHIIAINNHIGEYAARFNRAVTIVPNFIDTEKYFPRATPSENLPRLVWTGSHSSCPNLDSIQPALQHIQSRYNVPLRLIGAGAVTLPGVNFESQAWSRETQVSALQDCDIGLVPLLDHPWNPWKFFLKTIQYMAVGLPVVARRMGSNQDIICDGVNGFLAETQAEWIDKLSRLVENAELRRAMGVAARQTVQESYSADVWLPRVANLFNSLVGV